MVRRPRAHGTSGSQASVEMELRELAVLGTHPAHRAGDGAHDDRIGLDDVLAELDAVEHRSAGDTGCREQAIAAHQDRKSTRLNSSHTVISYAVFCLKKKKKKQ